MIRTKTRAYLLAATFALSGVVLAGFAPRTFAQMAATPASYSGKTTRTQFVVLRMSFESLQVRSLTDMREIRTFSYSPAIRGEMQKIHDAGGYQYGDKVVVWYEQGGDVALKIKGKPSKPK